MLTMQEATAARADAGVPAWHARRVLDDWPAVRVQPLELRPDHDGVRVRAVVRLGRLAPADVRVELHPDAGTRDAPRGAGRAMWSALAYDNGCYVFEATLAGEDVADVAEWVVRVRPRAALAAPDVLHRLRVDAPGLTAT